MGAFLFCAQCRGIRTRKGAELRKREAFSSAAREERSDEAEAGGASRTRTSLIAHHLIEKAPSDGGLSFFGPSAWDSNPPARLSQRPWPKNGKNEYCYLSYNI